MSVAVWPSDLPRPLRASFSGRRIDQRIAKPGPVRGYRRRATTLAKQYSLSLALDRSQKAVFDIFVDVTLSDGVLPFYMPDPTTDGWHVLDHNGVPLLQSEGVSLLLSARWLCQFAELPQEQLYGRGFLIQFEVVVTT